MSQLYEALSIIGTLPYEISYILFQYIPDNEYLAFGKLHHLPRAFTYAWSPEYNLLALAQLDNTVSVYNHLGVKLIEQPHQCNSENNEYPLIIWYDSGTSLQIWKTELFTTKIKISSKTILDEAKISNHHTSALNSAFSVETTRHKPEFWFYSSAYDDKQRYILYDSHLILPPLSIKEMHQRCIDTLPNIPKKFRIRNESSKPSKFKNCCIIF